MIELLATMFFTFFKIGAFSIGGGYAMIPLIQHETLAHGWLTAREVTDLVAISQITPGPFAVNAATFAGTKAVGVLGGIACTLGVIAPSILLTLLVSRFFFNFQKNKTVQAVLSGMCPAVVGLILSAAAVIAGQAVFSLDSKQTVLDLFAAKASVSLPAILIFIVAFIVIRKCKVHPILVVFAAAGVGVLLFAFGLG